MVTSAGLSLTASFLGRIVTISSSSAQSGSQTPGAPLYDPAARSAERDYQVTGQSAPC